MWTVIMWQLYHLYAELSKEIFSDLCYFYGGGVSHNEDIMHSFQKFIVVSFPTTLPLTDMEIIYTAISKKVVLQKP